MHSYLVKYEIKPVIEGNSVICAETLEKAIESIEKDNAIRVVSIEKLSTTTKQLLHEQKLELVIERQNIRISELENHIDLLQNEVLELRNYNAKMEEQLNNYKMDARIV